MTTSKKPTATAKGRAKKPRGTSKAQSTASAEPTAKKLPAHLQDDLKFKKGQSGNPKGRPKGSRNKLGEAFLDDLYADWEANGKVVIEAVRSTKPDVYMKVVASILPKDLNVNINKLEQASDEELLERLRDLESVIRPFIGDTGSNRDQERAGTTTAH